MTNAELSAVFEQVADLLEFQGANAFRVRAYRNAANAIRMLPEQAARIAADPDRKLTDIAGIGKDLANSILTLLATRRLPLLEELQAQIPHSALAMLRIPGLGPKKAATLFNELKIATLDQLRAACEAGDVRKLKGFGAKTEETIIAGLPFATSEELVRLYWAEADVFAQQLRDHLRACPSIKQLEIAGSYRRGKETVGDLDILVESADPTEVTNRLAEFPSIEAVLGRGDTKMSVRLATGLQVDLRIVPRESFGAALQYFTGSKEHNVVLRGLAKDRGLRINEYGVFRVPADDASNEQPTGPLAGKYVAGRTEEEVYGTLDLPLFPPELRENRWEFEWARAGKLPRLIELADMVGDLHMHTTATDGKHTLDEMAAAAQERGLQYIAITDHSKRVSMANGLDATRLRWQWDAIDELNAKLKGFRVLKGVEVDILEQGGLDLPDDVLAEADWVMASIHYGQNQPSEQITRRMLGAIENPHVTAISHPTGRMINKRKPYDVDLEVVFDAAVKHGKFMELNANPRRLDLNDVHCAAAKRHGIPIVISTDAHSIGNLDLMRYGILQARRAGLTKGDVVNTRAWEQVRDMLRR
ncbi:MAG: DNA polymerase/3'-5' exonuclease PolX [Pirellulales bacterium]